MLSGQNGLKSNFWAKKYRAFLAKIDPTQLFRPTSTKTNFAGQNRPKPVFFGENRSKPVSPAKINQNHFFSAKNVPNRSRPVFLVKIDQDQFLACTKANFSRQKRPKHVFFWPKSTKTIFGGGQKLARDRFPGQNQAKPVFGPKSTRNQFFVAKIGQNPVSQPKPTKANFPDRNQQVPACPPHV